MFGSTTSELRPGLTLPGVQLELGSPQSWLGTCEEGPNFQVKTADQLSRSQEIFCCYIFWYFGWVSPVPSDLSGGAVHPPVQEALHQNTFHQLTLSSPGCRGYAFNGKWLNKNRSDLWLGSSQILELMFSYKFHRRFLCISVIPFTSSQSFLSTDELCF